MAKDPRGYSRAPALPGQPFPCSVDTLFRAPGTTFPVVRGHTVPRSRDDLSRGPGTISPGLRALAQAGRSLRGALLVPT